jgi:hypothetical protein
LMGVFRLTSFGAVDQLGWVHGWDGVDWGCGLGLWIGVVWYDT